MALTKEKREYERMRYGRDQKHRLIVQARIRAKKRRLPFNLSAEDLKWPAVCPVLGVPIQYRTPESPRGRNWYAPSLDRIIPEKGYVKGNVVVISMRANNLKGNATADDLRAVIRYIELCDLLYG